jgi:hypothetical protein
MQRDGLENLEELCGLAETLLKYERLEKGILAARITKRNGMSVFIFNARGD